MADSLLPPNATPLDRAAESVMVKHLDAIDQPHRACHDQVAQEATAVRLILNGFCRSCVWQCGWAFPCRLTPTNPR